MMRSVLGKFGATLLERARVFPPLHSTAHFVSCAQNSFGLFPRCVMTDVETPVQIEGNLLPSDCVTAYSPASGGMQAAVSSEVSLSENPFAGRRTPPTQRKRQCGAVLST
eukprot:1781175-Rhodomonas_salina.1